MKNIPPKPVFVSAGHSNAAPGACANGIREADIATEFRNMVLFYLMRQLVPVRSDGDGADNWPLAKAATAARAHPIAVEFHCNAAANPSATGSETLSKREHFPLAAKITAAVSSQLGINDRGAKLDNAGQHSRLAFADAGGIIVELFFLTNKEDIAKYNARKWLAARAVAEVLAAESLGTA